MTRIRMTGWIVAAALAVGAQAETFHSQDGVVFEGTIRRVVSEAAVCNLLEERYRLPTEAEWATGTSPLPPARLAFR